MKRMRRLTVCLMVAWVLAAGMAAAYFQDAITGVRPAGMGEAFSAVSNDANTALFNPAGYARIADVELVGMYSDLYSNFQARLYTGQTDRLGYNYLALAVPMPVLEGSLGTSWAQFYSTFYKENTFILSYGRHAWTPWLDLGVNFKMLQWRIEGNDFSTDLSIFPSQERSKLGATLDVGLLATPMKDLNLAVVLDNILPADMGLTMHEDVPLLVKVAAAYTVRVQAGALDHLLVTVEESFRNIYYGDQWLFKCGGEAWFFHDMIALRIGFNENALTTGLSFRYPWTNLPLNMQLDYAFGYPLSVVGTYGSHRLGVTLGWDPGRTTPQR